MCIKCTVYAQNACWLALSSEHVSCCCPYFAAERGAQYYNEYVCLSVCVCGSLRGDNSGNVMFKLRQFSVHAAYDSGSVLLWRRCDTLYTSGFLDDGTDRRQTRRPKQKALTL